jgi:hypothetical protein
VFAGGYSTVALTESGKAYAWGLNNYGQVRCAGLRCVCMRVCVCVCVCARARACVCVCVCARARVRRVPCAVCSNYTRVHRVSLACPLLLSLRHSAR